VRFEVKLQRMPMDRGLRECSPHRPCPDIPAKAGIQAGRASARERPLFFGHDSLEPGLRRDDGG
jgi:hypothetical protein